MIETLLFRNEFKHWLEESKNLTPESANSYASYVSGINKYIRVDESSMCELVNKYHAVGSVSGINEVITAFLDYLYLEDICQITGRPQHTINNWRSGLLQYKEFLFDITEDAGEPLTEAEEVEAVVSILCDEDSELIIETPKPVKKARTRTYVFPAKDLMGNFKFRMTTQDRFYGEVFFPISFIKRVLYQNGEAEYFNNWIEDQINNIDIFCLGETHKFKDISELRLQVSPALEVSIVVDKQHKQVYSPSALGNALVPLTSRKLKWIAIDHVNPMKSILLNNVDNLPMLMLITSQLKGIAGLNPSFKEYKAAGSALFDSQLWEADDINALKNDIDLIKTFTKLQMMDSAENIKKGAR